MAEREKYWKKYQEIVNRHNRITSKHLENPYWAGFMDALNWVISIMDDTYYTSFRNKGIKRGG